MTNNKRKYEIAMAQTPTNITVTLPILPILALLFVTLKLCNVIAWSWWAVLSPLWAPFAIILGIFGIIGIAFLIAAVVKAIGR